MPVPVGFLELLQQQLPLFRFAPGRHDVQLQVGAVEAGVDDLGIGHAQLGEDVLDDIGSGRGRQGHDGRPAQVVDGFAQGQIVGAKVVAPLTDTVSLIDDEQLDFPGLEQLAELRIGEALGRGVDNGGPAQGDVLLGGDLLRRRERAIHAHRPDAVVEEVIDLVFHQRDERADDDGDAFQGESGQLEAEALAGAGRHDDEGVAPLEGRVHGLGLAGAKLAKAEVIADPVAQSPIGRIRAAGTHGCFHRVGGGIPSVSVNDMNVTHSPLCRNKPITKGRKDDRTKTTERPGFPFVLS